MSFNITTVVQQYPKQGIAISAKPNTSSWCKMLTFNMMVVLVVWPLQEKQWQLSLQEAVLF